MTTLFGMPACDMVYFIALGQYVLTSVTFVMLLGHHN